MTLADLETCLLTSSDGTVRTADARARDVLGRDEIVGLRIEELLAGPSAHAGDASGGPRANGGDAARKSNGRRAPFEVRRLDLDDAHGTSLTAWIVRRRRAGTPVVPEDGQAPEGHFDRLIRGSPTVLYRCGPGPDYAATFISSNATSVVGYPPDAFLQEPRFWLDRVHPADAPRVILALERGHREGEGCCEYRFRNRNGDWRWLHDRFSVNRSASGESMEIVGSLSDITDRRWAEDRLHQREGQLRALQRVAGVGFWEWNVLSDELHWSDEVYRLFGVSPGAFGGTLEAFIALVHPDDRARLRASVTAALADEVQYATDYRIVRPDGETRYFHGQGKVFRDPGGRAIRVAGSVIDVTRRRRAEDQAKAQRDEIVHMARVSTLGEMASGLAHELNQPLTSIANYASAALRGLPGGDPRMEPVRDCIRGARDQAMRAGKIIHRLRTLVSKSEPHYQDVHVDHMLEEMTDLVAVQARASRVEVEWALSSPMRPVWADAIQLQQVVVNLVHNGLDAVRACPPERRRVTVCAEERGDGMIEICVQDTGPGIPAGLLDRVFEPYFTTRQGGMGMGLSISRSIVEAHGGRIWATNRPGGGAAFHVLLPIIMERRNE